MKSKAILGYEDMTVFIHEDRVYLIGVNLDRSANEIPSMVLVQLDRRLNSKQTWHLKYAPLSNVPNKNWSPLNLPDGSLRFIVNIDPLLIVRRVKLSNGELSEDCEVVLEAKQQTAVKKMRNSTITYEWNDIPKDTRNALLVMAPEPDASMKRYVLMGHTKYVESDFIKDAWKVLYQHYFHIALEPLVDTEGIVHTTMVVHTNLPMQPGDPPTPGQARWIRADVKFSSGAGETRAVTEESIATGATVAAAMAPSRPEERADAGGLAGLFGGTRGDQRLVVLVTPFLAESPGSPERR